MINFDSINTRYRHGEAACVRELLSQFPLTPEGRESAEKRARTLIESVRADTQAPSVVAQLMQKYPLSSTQGLVLMCLAEALLRIPDTYTANQLLSDKLSQGQWEQLVDRDDSMLTRVSSFALRLSHKLLKPEEGASISDMVHRLVSKTAEPFIRQALRYTMQLMAQQFIVGSTIESGVKNAKALESRGYRYSYDMLGERAVTYEDADRYFEAYKHAINTISRPYAGRDPLTKPSISVKLSALHPRYSPLHTAQVMEELIPKMVLLAKKCHENQLHLTIDAEEADVLELSLHIFFALYMHPTLAGWDGLGMVVQAYQKRAPRVITELIALARQGGKKIHLRLVKGAYWDSEIKRAQVNGLSDYPVYTRKPHTDLSYLVCAQKLLANRDIIFPGFATHNAHTVASILELAGTNRTGFEFQRLHGMGEQLYTKIVGTAHEDVACRIYAPIGAHNDLLPYLVRRLLENGANSSFVHHLVDKSIAVDALIADPHQFATTFEGAPHPDIPRPRYLYKDRLNAAAFDLSDRDDQREIAQALADLPLLEGGALVRGTLVKNAESDVFSPHDRTQQVGHVHWATPALVEDALTAADEAFPSWAQTHVETRAACLERMADLLEAHSARLMALCVKEAGKTLPDALAEVCEAVDFCRYYALQARRDLLQPLVFEGPTGESNQMTWHGRGTFVCISPWNFPLAIFVGQVAAALVTGNCVLAKPANPTPLIASQALSLFHEAGIPVDVLHLVPGSSLDIGDALLKDPRIAGVALTGAVATGQAVNRTLASRPGPILPLIAETGGQNAMIVDSSALLEQVCQDVIASAFQSAGQRCSALRLLLVQEEIAPRLIEMIKGAMRTLVVGSPARWETDVAPVITVHAQEQINAHIMAMRQSGYPLYQCPLPPECAAGTFVAPTLIELPSIDKLQGEVFGPVLHVMRFPARALLQTVERINDLGFGLTLGVHSRIQTHIDQVVAHAAVGNIYVNRNMIGAVVGVQPFGGEKLSGTGPKAGGPHYLQRFMTERTVCVNTAAQGGNAALMMLGL